MSKRLAIVIGVAAAGVMALGAQTAAAEEKTFKYTSEYDSVSTANGYPSPGGTAVLEGWMKVAHHGGGYLTDHLTITEQLAPNVFAFKGHGVDDFGTGEQNRGELHHKFKGTTTVRADGSQRLAIEGHFTGGRVHFARAPCCVSGWLSYRNPSGHYKGSATVAAGSTVIVGGSKGELRMHAAGVIALGAQTAAAEAVKYETTLKITHEGHGHATGSVFWHGWVQSEVGKCSEGRRVILFRKRPGPDRKLGTARSYINRHNGRPHGGEWGLKAPWRGRVYAKVTRSMGDGFVCRADHSRILVNGLPIDERWLVASQAHGDGQTVKSKITIHAERGFVYGDVRADKAACEKRRQVKLYTRKSGDRRLEGTTTTGRTDPGTGRRIPGGWSIHDFDFPSPPLKYFAVVTRERNDGYVCTRDKTAVRRIA